MAWYDFLQPSEGSLLAEGGALRGGAEGGMDWPMLSILLGQGAQAFTAGEPTSWQYQLGGTAAGLGQSAKLAQIAKQQRAERREQWDWLKDILSGGATPQGIPGLTSFKVSPKGEMTLGVTPERETWDNVFGLEPLTLGGIEGSTTPARREGTEMRPFSRALAGYPQ